LSERTLALLVGGATVSLACFAGALGSIFEVSNRIVNAFGSPMLALFLAGRLWPRIRPRSVLLGGITGAVWSVAGGILVEPLALHYYAVVNLLGTLLLCALFELAGGGRPASERNGGENGKAGQSARGE
jgi:Na+/proline symporter